MKHREAALRSRLGIPADAERVIVYGESSHWDPNWLQTSDEYYHGHVKGSLDAVLDELQREKRRIFSAECIFFLRLYWDRQPEKRDIMRELINAGRLHLTGTGITTPDTLLPDTEAILRDYLLGQQWLRENGMFAEPKLAYLPDDFGHSPALPSLLDAAGFSMAGITRIDGMYFVACDYRLRSAYPLAGSSAALLEKELSTLDFVWRGPDGAEVLCHWNAFSYFQGDMLGHRGIMRWMDTMVIPWRREGYVAGQIDAHIKQLAPLSKTPYLFCPIGCDFNTPIPDLLDLLDRYNAGRYPASGVWAVNASMEDYLELVDCHRDKLPTLCLDPNPYWMGFYATRPRIKRLCKELTHKLVLIEKLGALQGEEKRRRTRKDTAAAWDLVAIANHHDFITGTSPDRVYQAEQRPWLEKATRNADRALSAFSSRSTLDAPATPPPRWSFKHGWLEVETKHYRAAFFEDEGGCLVSLEIDGRRVIHGPANDVLIYRDSGGLWRMGHEFFGGTFRPIARASAQPAKIRVEEEHGGLLVWVEQMLLDRRFIRWAWLHDDEREIRFRLSGAAPRNTTVTCRFPTLLSASKIAMDVPGGALERPLRKLYDPTFWAARSYAHLRDWEHGAGLAALLSGPVCVSAPPGDDGFAHTMEWVALRNATRERAFGILPILAHPASGTDDDRYGYDYTLLPTAKGDHLENRLTARARSAFLRHCLHIDEEHLTCPIDLDSDQALIGAIKPAHHGEGVIVRIERMVDYPLVAKLGHTVGPILRASTCDARERDVERLGVVDGKIEVLLKRQITSLRLVLEG